MTEWHIVLKGARVTGELYRPGRQDQGSIDKGEEKGYKGKRRRAPTQAQRQDSLAYAGPARRCLWLVPS